MPAHVFEIREREGKREEEERERERERERESRERAAQWANQNTSDSVTL